MRRSLKLQVPTFVFIRTVLNTPVRMVYPFLPAFARSLGVGFPAIAFALTLRSTAGIFGPFLAFVADSRGRKIGMLFGLALFVIGGGWMVIWPGYPAFVGALILMMIGNFVLIPSMQAYLGDRVPYERRGLVLALTEFGWSLSFILSVPLIGLVLGNRGVRSAFTVLLGMGLLSILVLAVLVPRDAPPENGGTGVWLNLRTVFSHAPALYSLLMGASFSAANETVNLVFGVWMERSFGLQLAALGLASILIGFSELGGEALVGGITDRLGKERAVRSGLIVNSLAALMLPFLSGSLPAALVGLALFYLTFEFSLVSSLPLLTEMLPAARATMMATYIGCVSLGRGLADLLGPALYELSTRLALLPGSEAGSQILASGVVAALFNGLAIWALSQMIRQTARLA